MVKLTPFHLARALDGNLVPQDPRDEPAEKLLKRIRSVQLDTHETKRKFNVR
jgi:hypothetical protein